MQPSGKPMVVLDLDETVLRRTAFGRAVVYLPGLRALPGGIQATGKLLPGCARAPAGFGAMGLGVAAVTARWGGLAHDNTRTWMDSAGMESIPLTCAPTPLPTSAATAAWKTREIAALALRHQATRLVAAVGDKPSDLIAYAANNVELAIGVAHQSTSLTQSVLQRATALCDEADAIAAKTPRSRTDVVVVAEFDGDVPSELHNRRAARVIIAKPGQAWNAIARVVAERA